MPMQHPQQLRSSGFVNTIQILEELVEKVFRKNHFNTVQAPPPTIRFKVFEEFQRMKELFKAA